MDDLRLRIESAKGIADPSQRDAALASLEAAAAALEQEDRDDILGLIRTYRGDARLQLEGASHG